LTNEDLVLCSSNKFFEEGKDLIVEGLAVRLNPTSALEKKAEFKINLAPRVMYLPKDEKDHVLPDGTIVYAVPPPVPEPPVVLDEEGAEIIEKHGVIEEILTAIDSDT